MRFEPLRYEHLRQMAEIEKEAFDMPWTENMFIPEVGSPDATYVVGTRGDEVICYGGFHSVLDEAHITNIAVKSSERGKGIGKFLMATLIGKAREKGAKYITLEVKTTNKSRNLDVRGFRLQCGGRTEEVLQQSLRRLRYVARHGGACIV